MTGNILHVKTLDLHTEWITESSLIFVSIAAFSTSLDDTNFL